MTGWLALAAVLAGFAVGVRSPGGQSCAPPTRAKVPRGMWQFRRREPPNVGLLLAGFAAELRAGQPTLRAFGLACDSSPTSACPRAELAAKSGADVPSALRADAEASEVPVLRALAACWEVAEHSGAGLARAVERLAESHRGAMRARGQVRSEVAAARASAHLLSLLPFFGLFLGHLMGAHPLRWLFGSPVGVGVLIGGASLQGIGLWWLQRMTRGVSARLST